MSQPSPRTRALLLAGALACTVAAYVLSAPGSASDSAGTEPRVVRIDPCADC